MGNGGWTSVMGRKQSRDAMPEGMEQARSSLRSKALTTTCHTVLCSSHVRAFVPMKTDRLSLMTRGTVEV